MSTLGAVMAAVRDPMQGAYAGVGRLWPQALLAGYARRCRALGLRGVRLIVSLDCDTPEDAQVVEGVCERLRAMDIVAALAVPGALLERDAGVYRALAAAGHEILNHGYAQHTRWNAGAQRYESHFFYHELPWEVLEQDIRQGDAAIRRVVGTAAQGFRTPHFGTCQQPRRLRAIHRLLQDLGCKYSTSTLPWYALRWGPLFTRFGLPEVPVVGTATRPLHVLDSWSCFAAPARRLGPEDYAREARLLARQLAALDAGVINCYVDPGHVAREDAFFEAVAAWRQVATPVTYAQLLGAAQRSTR